MKKTFTIGIPETLRFADLKLKRHQNGDLSFDWEPILALCEQNKIDPEIMRSGPEDNVSGLIVAWYGAHIDAGGAIDPVAHEIMLEVMGEELAGQKFSYPPGAA
jgi:hypothetical protein